MVATPLRNEAVKPSMSLTVEESQVRAIEGAGVIWTGIPFENLFIPAKAGIPSVGGAFPMGCRVDSRLRGNDCTWDRPFLANDTRTRLSDRVIA